MNRPLKGLLPWAAACAVALPVFLLPLYNPDLFWHLSAGRWIAAHAAVPSADFLSFTKRGAPWLDFEWGSELLFYGAYAGGGLAGLWALKSALMLLCWLAFDRCLRVDGVAPGLRASALLLWALAAFSWSDLRPELFSVLLFTVCLAGLEAMRADLWKPSWRSWLGAAALFALWSDLHAGFPLALAGAALYAAGELIAGRWRPARRMAGLGAAAACGSLLNPYGAGPYAVALLHLREGAELSRDIAEWRPLNLANPAYWPVYGLMVLAVLALGALVVRARREGLRRALPWGLILLAVFLGLGAWRHERLAAFFGVVAVLLAALAARAIGRPRALLAAVWISGLAYAGWLAPRLYLAGPFNDKDVPVRAAEFVACHGTALTPLRLFNDWGWGGYLGWRLGPSRPVFTDGRYIFQDILAQEAAATRSPRAWESFLSRYALTGALVGNRAVTFPATRRYPDGSTRTFQRPWYLEYFPRRSWALVYWDDKALLFVERSAVAPSWLAAHEYRWLLPRDRAAFEDARSRGEIPAGAFAAERRRHDEESRL
ncbi:MAG: hypothetical protein KGK30_01290 [Elusimicrobia bacterium]|nr:hypothetical protein [Elusimicrobiota bacterium]